MPACSIRAAASSVSQPPLRLLRPGPRRNALNTRLGQLGFQLPEDQLNDVFRRFKNLADRKKVWGSCVWGWGQILGLGLGLRQEER